MIVTRKVFSFKSSFARPLLSPKIPVLLVSRAESKAALKPFFFAVHPDLFGQHPQQRAINEDSLKRLNSYIDNLENKFPVHPTHLTFYLKNGVDQSDMKRIQDEKFKTVRISLFSRDLYFTVNHILKSCGMNDDLKHNCNNSQTNEIPSPYGGPLDWLQVMRKYGKRRNNYENEFQPKTRVTLATFLQDQIPSAKEKLQQSEKVHKEIVSLSRKVCDELGLVDLVLDCGWSCISCRHSLKNLLQLCKDKTDDVGALSGRSIVLTRWTGVDPRGHVMLGVEDVPQFWLSLFSTLEDYDVLAHQVPLWDKRLSKQLGDIQVMYDHTSPPSIDILEYLNYLHRVVMTLRRSRFGRIGHPLIPGSFKNFRCRVFSPNSSLNLSSDGTFIIPASTPSDLILEFLHKNKEKSFLVMNDSIRNVAKEKEMIRKCQETLRLKSLTKDDSVSVSQMLSCLEALVRHPFELLHDTRLIVSKYYNVSVDGHVTIPWDWE